jgi:hypothetical protein
VFHFGSFRNLQTIQANHTVVAGTKDSSTVSINTSVVILNQKQSRGVHMKRALMFLMIIVAFTFCGCDAEPSPQQNEPQGVAKVGGEEDFSLLGMVRKQDWTMGIADDVSSQQSEPEDLIPQVSEANKPASNAQSSIAKPVPPVEQQPIQRKIIRNGKLTLEIENPGEGQQKITAIVESHNGFVITSEFSQFSRAIDNQSVTIAVRVPAAQFNETLAEIHAVGTRIIFENITGQDVTEEFLDLQARMRTQKALEEQLLQIMKKTGNVSNALEVQRELTNVRTEIERITGRTQFLENQSALSTITILLQTPSAIVAASTSGVGDKFKRAFADGIRFALGIILFLIRALFALTPILVFIVYPIYFWRKRFSGRPITRTLPTTPASQ